MSHKQSEASAKSVSDYVMPAIALCGRTFTTELWSPTTTQKIKVLKPAQGGHCWAPGAPCTPEARQWLGRMLAMIGAQATRDVVAEQVGCVVV